MSFWTRSVLTTQSWLLRATPPNWFMIWGDLRAPLVLFFMIWADLGQPFKQNLPKFRRLSKVLKVGNHKRQNTSNNSKNCQETAKNQENKRETQDTNLNFIIRRNPSTDNNRSPRNGTSQNGGGGVTPHSVCKVLKFFLFEKHTWWIIPGPWIGGLFLTWKGSERFWRSRDHYAELVWDSFLPRSVPSDPDRLIYHVSGCCTIARNEMDGPHSLTKLFFRVLTPLAQ